MDGAFTGFPAGPAHRLALDRHHSGRHTDQRGSPGDETTLELLRVEGGEDVAVVIVRWGGGEKWPGEAEEGGVDTIKTGDINEGFGSGQHREQREQENLFERIHDLSALAMVRHILEMIEEYDRLE